MKKTKEEILDSVLYNSFDETDKATFLEAMELYKDQELSELTEKYEKLDELFMRMADDKLQIEEKYEKLSKAHEVTKAENHLLKLDKNRLNERYLKLKDGFELLLNQATGRGPQNKDFTGETQTHWLKKAGLKED